MDILAISLRKETTLIALLTVKKKGVSVVDLGRMDPILNSLTSGNVDDMAVFFLDAMQFARKKKTAVYVSLPAAVIQTEYIETEYVPQEDWQTNLVPGIVKHLQYGEDELCVDFPLAYMKADSKMAITACCTETFIIQTLMDAADLAGVDLESIEMEEAAILRFMNQLDEAVYFAEMDKDATSIVCYWPGYGMRSVTVPTLGYMHILSTNEIAKLAQTIVIFDKLVQKTFTQEDVRYTPIFLISERERQIVEVCRHTAFGCRFKTMEFSDLVFAPEYTDEEVVAFAGAIGLGLKSIFERMNEDETIPDNELHSAREADIQAIPSVQEQAQVRNDRFNHLFGDVDRD